MNKHHTDSRETSNAAHDVPTVSEVIGEGENAHRIVRVGVWELTAWVGRGEADEPRMRDIDLGTRLGYPNPKEIRKLARDHEKAGNINPFHVRAAVARTGAVPRFEDEMWFSEADALWLASQSKTPQAVALTKEMIRVYIAARKGLLPQSAASGMTAEQFAQAMVPVLSMMTALASRLTALEERVRDGGIMAPERASAIKARVSGCVDSLARCGLEKKRKASLRIHKRLKMRVGWYGDHCRLDNMPARHEADVLRELEIVEHETNGAVAASRQLTLPRLAVVANNDVQKKRA